MISSIVTVGNYEYGFFWYLYQDATWQFEAKLTGIVHSAGWVSDERSPYSLPLGEGFVTSHHQHFFCARLDLDVDGTANIAFQSEAVCEPWGAGEPRRRRVPARAPDVHARVGRRARTSRPRPPGGSGSRTRRAANRIGDPVSYELVPGDYGARRCSSPTRRCASARGSSTTTSGSRRTAPTSATRRASSRTSTPARTACPRGRRPTAPLEGEDVVLWYVFGAHHFPRLEDWPVMPVAYCGFQLRPVGFFDANPALDVPPPAHCAH